MPFSSLADCPKCLVMGLSAAFVQSWKLCLYQLGAVLVRSLCYWKVLESIGNIGIVVDGDRGPAVVSQH